MNVTVIVAIVFLILGGLVGFVTSACIRIDRDKQAVYQEGWNEGYKAGKEQKDG